MIRKLRLLLFFVFSFAVQSHATHLMGGDITWDCIPTGQPNAGKFVFTMRLYRDCLGIPLGNSTETLLSNSPVTNIQLNFVSQVDVSPKCNPLGYNYTCPTAVLSQDTGAIEEYIYRSNPVTLNGVPPVGGWTFWWTLCCRNVSIMNLLTPGALTYTLRAKMYSYNGKNTYPCFDSSPRLFEQPKIVICTGYDYSLNHNGVDPDLDSLYFDWAQPLNTDISTPVTFISPFSYTNPLPDASFNSGNKPAVINNVNGEISFKVISPRGSYVMCNSVKAYRCGILIAEIFRDIQVVLKNCEPIIAGSPPTYNKPPDVQPLPFAVFGANSYIDTVVAGDTVCFPLSISDADINASFQFQWIHLDPTGQQISRTFIDENDCLRPPCATISPRPDSTLGQINLGFQFCWVTSCNHVRKDTLCEVLSNVHNFVFKSMDDFCPIPGLNVTTLTIVVLPAPGIPSTPSITQIGDTLFCSVTASSYQWYLNGNLIVGANSNYLIPNNTGNYYVEVSSGVGCPVISFSYYFNNTSIFSLEEMLSLDISPNPFNSKVRIRCESIGANTVEIRLLDIVGKQVSFFMNESPTSSFEQEMDYSFLPPGIYLLQIRSGTAKKTVKLMKYD